MFYTLSIYSIFIVSPEYTNKLSNIITIMLAQH